MLLLNMLCALTIFFAVLYMIIGWRYLVRPFLRKQKDWEKISLIALAVSLFGVLALSWLGACRGGKPFWDGLFEALRILFEVFEGNSKDFRDYAVHFPHVYGFLSCAVPALTVFTAARLLWHYLPHHVPWFKKEWYLFSELDANSVRMAKDLAGDDNLCIFLRTRRDQANQELLTELGDVHFFLYPQNESRFLFHFWRRDRILRFFFLSENTDENFQRMQDFLLTAKTKNLFKPRRLSLPDGRFQQEMYLLSETESAPMLIDHLRGLLKDEPCFQNTELRLLDRFRATSYDLLRNLPLHAHIDKSGQEDQLHVLILGFGKIGREFFRAACSLGTLHDCQTEFTLCDLEIRTKLRMFLSQCPELCDSVTVHARKLNVETKALEKLIEADEYHYILVALGDDERNIRVASWLKRYYRKRHWEYQAGTCTKENQPQICVNIEDSIKHEYTKNLWENAQKRNNSKSWDKALHVFGGLDQVFTQKVLMPQTLWNAARFIHQNLNPPEPGRRLNWSEYERRSSIACAVRAEYLDASHSTASTGALADTEHVRWMAYVRSEGLCHADTALVDAYFDSEHGKHVDTLGKLTPCLVETRQELETVWNHLTGHYQTDYVGRNPFWERDKFLVDHAAEIARIAADK